MNRHEWAEQHDVLVGGAACRAAGEAGHTIRVLLEILNPVRRRQCGHRARRRGDRGKKGFGK